MNILGRARKVWSGWTPPEQAKPQPYSVACPEGHVLRGWRTEGYQALRCPECGEGIFVLPASPLPEPALPSAARRRAVDVAPLIDDGPIVLADPPAQFGGETDAQIEWMDEVSPTASRTMAEVEVPEIEPPKPRPKPSAKLSQPRAAPSPPPIAIPPRISLGQRLRRHKVAVIVLGVTFIVAATVGFKVWRQRREELPRIAEAHRVEGMAALEEGDFNTAKLELGRAASGFESLGDEKAGAVRQLADESAILADLVPESLEDLIDLAAFKTEEWPELFTLKYQGRSIILDAPLSAPTEAGAAFGIEYHIVGAGRAPKRGRIDLAGFKLFESTGHKAGDRVPFGARLASIRLGGDGAWLVGLEPDSGVFLTNPQALAALPGWIEPEEAAP